MVELILQRLKETNKSTLGKLTSEKDDYVICLYTLELGGKSSAIEGSMKRIPAGEYKIIAHDSEKFSNVFELFSKDSSDHRVGILIHCGNTIKDTEGCIIVGTDYCEDVNEDYAITGGTSRPALNILREFLANETNINLTIKEIE